MNFYLRYLFLLVCLLFTKEASAQISGKVVHDNEPVSFAHIQLQPSKEGAISDVDGRFSIVTTITGKAIIRISAVGFRIVSDTIDLTNSGVAERIYTLEKDLLQLDQVVVTGSRSDVPLYQSPVIISRMEPKSFEHVQAVSLAEGLNFSPGLRVENNCQNCGFTQLRMNGLPGPYTQILINSRPVYSALAGVYGLEMLPARMIDRVEVIRGAGSVLYGGNAIAGTVNILTKDPVENELEVSYQQSVFEDGTPDGALLLNGALVAPTQQRGVRFYGLNRNRAAWDANGDGFTERTTLRNTTLGIDAFYELSDRSRLKANLFHINEFRRGGSNLDRPPHQAALAEQLNHRILGWGLSWEQYSKNLKHRLSVYTSGQQTQRDSYYGGGGRILGADDTLLTEDDRLALNAYGVSSDLMMVGGIQYNFEPGKRMNLTLGTEYVHNQVNDQMPGYGRSIEQETGTVGTYFQAQWKPVQRITFLGGARADYFTLKGRYRFEQEDFNNTIQLPVLVPRVAMMVDINPELKWRVAFAQGYRAPQAFDEDLHIQTVGGTALFTRLDPDLKTERSNSSTMSLNYALSKGPLQWNMVAEGFYTTLLNPFLLSNQTEQESGVAIITKRNGKEAYVSGINLEVSAAYRQKWVLQTGATFQNARFRENEVIWESDADTEFSADSIITTDQLLRTPSIYGYYSLQYIPNTSWSFVISGVYSGSMPVPHVIDAVSEYTVIKNTRQFFEQNIKLSYSIPLEDKQAVEISIGILNMFNSFQQDFDRGPLRDAGYVYGPLRPRTFTAGVKWKLL